MIKLPMEVWVCEYGSYIPNIVYSNPTKECRYYCFDKCMFLNGKCTARKAVLTWVEESHDCRECAKRIGCPYPTDDNDDCFEMRVDETPVRCPRLNSCSLYTELCPDAGSSDSYKSCALIKGE